MSELTQLLGEAASNLSGHPVKVRFRVPSRIDAKGISFKLGDTAIVDLHPSYIWDGDELLDVITHEAAHIKDLWFEWGAGLPADLPSGSVRFSKQARSLPVVQEIEQAADSIAARWLRYAEENYHRYSLPGDDEYRAKLRTLANMER